MQEPPEVQKIVRRGANWFAGRRIWQRDGVEPHCHSPPRVKRTIGQFVGATIWNPMAGALLVHA